MVMFNVVKSHTYREKQVPPRKITKVITTIQDAITLLKAFVQIGPMLRFSMKRKQKSLNVQNWVLSAWNE